MIKSPIVKTIYSLFILTCLLLAACDHPNYIHYAVKNKTADTLSMDFSYQHGSAISSSRDTFIKIMPNQEDTLFSVYQTSSSVYNPELTDTMEYIRRIKLHRISDGKKLNKNIEAKENWKFVKGGRNNAMLEFEISDSDF